MTKLELQLVYFDGVTFTTRAPEFDVEHLFDFLRGRAKPARRLHPRRQLDLPPDVSKFGGAILWPHDEPFPEDPYSELRAVPVLQLLREDVPELEFFEDTDCLQILWYPEFYDADLYLGPQVELHWRHRAKLKNAGLLEPVYWEDDNGFRVEECAIHPEIVLEYPYIWSLSSTEQSAIRAWEKTQGESVS